MADIDLSGLLKRFISDYGETKEKRQKRYETGVSELTNVVEMFKPGGEFSKTMEDTALNTAKAGFAGVGGIRPTSISNTLQSAIRRLQTTGQTGALANRAQYKTAFPQIFADPSAITNLATGGFSGVTQRLLAESLGGPLSNPYDVLNTPTNLLLGRAGGYSGAAVGQIGAARGLSGMAY